jgi:HD-GYP domain-containing protein (c-di-GMP phosphodiesterase class II)
MSEATILIVDDEPVNLTDRHFDPDMTDAFLGGFERFAEIAQTHRDPTDLHAIGAGLALQAP